MACRLVWHNGSAHRLSPSPPAAQRERIHRLEEKIRRRVGVGSYITQKRLMEEMVGTCCLKRATPSWLPCAQALHVTRPHRLPSFMQVALGESEMFVMRALLAMAAGGDVEFKRERSVIQRVR